MAHVNKKQVFLYIIRSIKPFPVGIMAMIVQAVVGAVDLSLRPYLLKTILDRVAEGSQSNVFSYLMYPVIFYLLMYGVLTTAYRVYGYCVEMGMIPKMRKNIAHNAFEALLNKNQFYYQNNFAGNLTNKINDLTTSVPDLVQIIVDGFFYNILALSIAIFTLWTINVIFAISMIVWTFFFVVASVVLSPHLTHLSDMWSEKVSMIFGKIVDALSNILAIKLFATKSSEQKNLDKVLVESVQAEKKLQRSFFLMWILYGYSFFFIQLLNFYFLCKGRQNGWVTVGDFALVVAINVSIVDFLWMVGRDFSQFSKFYGKIAQALRVLFDASELIDAQNGHDLKIVSGGITFKNVSFSYPGGIQLFTNQSVEIKGGQRIGLVGYSGSGKSTFANLITRLHDVTDGSILIDYQDIRMVTQESLRKNIAMVPQDPLLFHRNLMDNIRYGNIDASDEEVVAAAIKARAHEFINKLPEKYQSLVGERGVKLSGGQRQRIALARALLKDAPIIILDEATSQLDSITESCIQDVLWNLMAHKTTIVIAHRLSTLLSMDRILVFDKGAIVEDGSHQDLLTLNGLYKKLWDSQIGGFLVDIQQQPEMFCEKRSGEVQIV